METCSKDCEALSSFECGIEHGNLIEGLDYIWCVSQRSSGLSNESFKYIMTNGQVDATLPRSKLFYDLTQYQPV